MPELKINVDFTEPAGKIKPVHGVGQPPFTGTDFSRIWYLKDASIPFSRLHDVGGAYGEGRYVDIPNIFRDFEADPGDPASYDFVFTDLLVTALVENGVEPFFRLGVTIENAAAIKSYRIDPPKDFLKWAKICEGIIRHYTEGWANGFRYNIRYWEIWNEPDFNRDARLNECWSGTKERFYEFYTVVATRLKRRFPRLKIGGYGCCGFKFAIKEWMDRCPPGDVGEYYREFFEGFIEYVKRHDAPLDFFTWHSYTGIERTGRMITYVRERLDSAGFTDTENICDEWNCSPSDNPSIRGTAKHAAFVAGMLITMQNRPLDAAMLYDARIGFGMYGSLFNAESTAPYLSYYVMKWFGELYKLGTAVKVTGCGGNVYAAAATDGERGAVLLANTGEVADIPITVTGQRIAGCRVIDAEHYGIPVKLPGRIPGDTVILLETTKRE